MDDGKIKKALNETVKDIFPPEGMLYGIKALSSEEEKKMKKIRPIKLAVICAFVLGVFTVGVIGAGKAVMVESYSTHLEEVKHFPTEQEVEKMVGYIPSYTEKLGEYDFESCVPVHSHDIDETGNNMGDRTGISFNYKTDKGILTLDTDPEPLRMEKYTDKLDYKGKEIYYHSIVYKFVPPDYKPTDEELALKEKGELEISYGSDEEKLMNTQSLLWEDNGICYCLLEMDVEIDKDDFVKMAYQVIDAG